PSIPYTHSLLGSLFWAALVYVVFRFIPPSKVAQRSAIALVMALGVFSHWILDFFVHRPDLGLIGDIGHVGLGLYDYPVLAFCLEALILLGGLLLYMRSTTGTTFLGKYGMYFFAAFLLLMNVFSYWGPNPPSVQVAAIFNGVFYFVAAGLALWLDRKRLPRVQSNVVPTTQAGTIGTSAEAAR
ncbi:MAG: metal-dependent hydrolase, partial [Chloroflexota bacterium]|nr:metal-dependent hydrolase [Chloroflexota bacterium]